MVVVLEMILQFAETLCCAGCGRRVLRSASFLVLIFGWLRLLSSSWTAAAVSFYTSFLSGAGSLEKMKIGTILVKACSGALYEPSPIAARGASTNEPFQNRSSYYIFREIWSCFYSPGARCLIPQNDTNYEIHTEDRCVRGEKTTLSRRATNETSSGLTSLS